MFIEQLGLGSRLAYPPRADQMPRYFNSNAKQIWERVVKHVNRPNRSPRQQWELAVELFVKLAIEQDIFPYDRRSDEAVNDQIIEQMIRSRSLMVRFLNRNRVFKVLSMRHSPGIRGVRMHRNGSFTVYASARVRVPPDVEQWARKVFRHSRMNTRYSTNVSPELEVSLWNEGSAMSLRWHLGYEITIAAMPRVPDTPMPNVKQMEHFILDKLWRPVSLRQRPQSVMHQF